VTRAVYLLGAPGVGKTTLMRHLQSPYLVGEATRAWPRSLLWLTPLYADSYLAGVEIGRPRDRFGGTDALSMGVMPQALAWLELPLPRLVLGEGSRLGTAAFLAELGKRADLTAVHLTASPEALAARRTGRGSDQSASWMRGAATRARNTATRLRDECSYVRVVDLDATDATPAELSAHVSQEVR
jgi:P-loop Nucleotide Kinase3